MFECSLYGTLEDITQLDEHLIYLRYKKTSTVKPITMYKKECTKIFIENNELTLRERPDTNKSRISICRKIIKQKIKGDIFEELGYLRTCMDVDTIEYVYENTCFEISGGSMYVVKLYILTNSPNEGERILGSIRDALKNVVELKKPPISWFLK